MKYISSEIVEPLLYFQLILKFVHMRERASEYTHLQACAQIFAGALAFSFEQKLVMVQTFGKRLALGYNFCFLQKEI